MEGKNSFRRIRVCSIAVFLALVLGGGYFLNWYCGATRFRGDGEIQDTGFWSYPRYHITFPEVRLDKPGQYTYRCSGLPPVAMTLTLSIAPDHTYDVLKGLSTKVDVRFVDDRDCEICRAAGPLNQWILQWSVIGGGFWQPSSRDISISPFRTYSLNLKVENVDPASPPLVTRIILEGGGNELP